MPLRTRSKTRSPPSSSSSGGSNHHVEIRRELPRRAAKKSVPPVEVDKENVKNKIAFQPPSPLTSRRKSSSSAQKSSAAKKELSPNRISQWNRESSSSAGRQPRSSPIHHAGYQDRDHRDASRSQASTNLKRGGDMSYTLSNDLDLIGKAEDDFGPLISDCLNLGSFGNDSPPRGETRSYRRGASPPSYRYGGGYRTSPRAAAPSSYQQPPYYSAPPAQQQQGYSNYPGGYHPPPYGGSDQQAPPWASPRAYEYDSARPKEPPYGRATSPPSKKSRRWEGTPEKKATRSPFRSPISNQGSAKKFKKSPIWGGAGTPSIGMYGSFGMMDTPGAHHLDAFSPMGPSFASFENDSPPLPLAGEILDDRLSLVAGDRRVPPPSVQQRRTGRLDSPGGFNFMNEMAHMPGTSNVSSSPVRTSKRDPRERDNPRYYDKDNNRRDRPPVDRLPPPQMPLHQAPPPRRPSPPSTGGSKRMILTSPLAASSHHGSTGRRATWYDSRQAPGPFRLELGDNLAKPSETRRGLEGINSMMRGTPNPQRSAPPPNHPGAYDQRGAPYRDMNTPGKMGGSAPPQQGRMPSSQPRAHAQSYPGPPTIAPRQSGIPTSASRYQIQPSPAHHHPSSARIQPPPLKIAGTPSEKVPSGQRRNPCNCKKSKCLKLYCECFAGEMYCDGCNCNDCQNNKTHEDVRSKAMKDTRAKNPNAFKPRFAQRNQVGPTGSPPSAHNMGCKCKRSECLKKYCECFQAGVMCGNKCKCVDCLNYPGSQALIDKRRKIKDHRGADFAMRIADEAWKGKHGAPASRGSSVPPSGSRHPAASPAPARPSLGSHGHHRPPHPMQSPPGPHHHSHPPRGPPPGGPPPPYMSHHPPMGHPPGGYAGYHMHPQSHHGSNKNSNSSRSGHPHHLSDSRAPTKPLPRVEPKPHLKPSAPKPTGKSETGVIPMRVKMEDANAESATIKAVVPAAKIKASHVVAAPASKAAAKPIQVVATPVAASKPVEPLVTPANKPIQVTATPVAASKPVEPLVTPVVKPIQVVATPVAASKPAKPLATPVVKPIQVVATPVAVSKPAKPLATPVAKPTEAKVTAKLENVEASGAPLQMTTSHAATPRTPGVRLGYDPSSSKKKRQLSPGQNEATFPHFGNMPEQPKTTALAVFSFLSNDEIYNAALVSKRWNRLAMDEELWQF